MYLKRNDIEFLLFSRYLMMNSLLYLWKFNFYRNLCKDCFAPLSRQGLDKDSGRNRSIIKHKKGYYLSVTAPIPQFHFLQILIIWHNRMNVRFNMFLPHGVVIQPIVHSVWPTFVIVLQWILWQRWTASGVAISTALTVWRETVRNSLE